jgi:hypothetical protein
MAGLSLKNFKKYFADDIKLWAAQCTIRECDEETKGHFVSFVDQGNQSFDVSLSINPNQEIISSNCECPKGDTLCQHKFALMLHLVGNEKIIAPKLIKNKISPQDKIFSELSLDDLKTWLKKVFEQDKALQIEFIQEFSKGENKFWTLPALEKKLKELLKAVVGSKRTVEAAGFKKAMSLWENFAMNHLKLYLKNPTQYIHFEQLDILYKAMSKQVSLLHTSNSESYDNIQRKIEAKIAAYFNELLSEEDFKLAVELLTSHLLTSQGFESNLLKILWGIFEKANENGKMHIIELLIERYTRFHSDSKFGDKTFTHVIWAMIKTTNTFEKYGEQLLPINQSNDFNTEFIEKLINTNKLEKAIELCNKLIRNHYYPDYNFPYWVFLKKLYTATNQPEKSIEIKKQLVPFTGNFEDFLAVYETMTDENEKRSYRINLLTKFRTNAQRDKFSSTDLFCIKLAGYEKNYTKLIDYLPQYPLIQYYVPYLEEMLKQNKKKTFLNIINHFKHPPSGVSNNIINTEKENYLAVYQILSDFFQEDELTVLLRQHLPFSQKTAEGSLVNFISKNLI